jgi:hypothetical protein
MLEPLESDELIFGLSGSGNKRTKPFIVPDNASYFTIRWQMDDQEGEIELYSTDDTDSVLDYLTGAGPSDSQWYGTGKFFFAVKSSNSWEISVVIEEDAFSQDGDEITDESTEDDESDLPVQCCNLPDEMPVRDGEIIRGMQWACFGVADDPYYAVSATYTNVNMVSLRESRRVNWVQDLHRGFITDFAGQTKLQVDLGDLKAISEIVLELDQWFRHNFAGTQDNWPHPPTNIEMYDLDVFTNYEVHRQKQHLRLSSILYKAGSAGPTHVFATGSDRIQLMYCSANHSIGQKQAKRDRANTFWDGVGQNMANRNAAKTFWDEGRRRGF